MNELHLIGPRGVVFSIAALAVLLLIVPSSFAEPVAPTRSEYVQRVEPICKAETRAHHTILQGVEEMVNQGRSKQAAPRLLTAASLLRKGVQRIAAVPRPPTDVDRLKSWLGYSKVGATLLTKTSFALRGGDRAKIQTLTDELLKETKRANATVVGFEFNYCRIKPGRFV